MIKKTTTITLSGRLLQSDNHSVGAGISHPLHYFEYNALEVLLADA